MIKTGRTVNVLLGIGDSERFPLLGGSFGEAGDIVTLLGSHGQRRIAKKKPGNRSAYSSGTKGVYDPNYSSGWNPNYRRPPSVRNVER